MKKIIICLVSIVCMNSCITGNKEESNQRSGDNDTIVDVATKCVNKMPNEELLYDQAKHFDMLYKIFRMNGGSANPYSLFDQFAAAHCKHCSVTVSNECWKSAELCHEWMESFLGKEKFKKLNLDGYDLMSYLNGRPEKVHEGIVPDVATTKRLLKKYCREVYLPKYTVEQCYRDGGFDMYALGYAFDGQGAVDWTEQHWHEYVDVKIIKSEYDIKQSTDSTDVFNVTFQYCFAQSKKYGDKPHDDIEFIVELTEKCNGDFYYGMPKITHYLNPE